VAPELTTGGIVDDLGIHCRYRSVLEEHAQR
jgi:hypothetical protein